MNKEPAKSKWRKIITNFGIPIHVYNMPQANSVVCATLVNAGTRDEKWPKEAGLAHALEHMAFQGTKRFPTGHAMSTYIEDTAGYMNAHTGREHTFFYNLVPANAIEKSIHVLAEQMMRLLIPKERITTEMGNIVEEIHRNNDNPQNYILKTALTKMYGEHPLGRDGAGTVEAVSGFKRDDFIRFHSRYYHANGFDFIVVGKLPDGSEKLVVTLFQKHFRGIKENVPNSREIEPSVINSVRFFQEHRNINQAHIVLIAPTGQGTTKDVDTVLSFFNIMISGGMSFPLFTEVRDKLGLCYEIWSQNMRFSDLGCFLIYIGAKKDKYKEAIDEIFKILKETKTNQGLFDRAKQIILGKLDLGFDNPVEIMEMASKDINMLGRPRDKNELCDIIQSVTLDEVSNVAGGYLDPTRFTLAALMPEGIEVSVPNQVQPDYSAGF